MAKRNQKFWQTIKNNYYDPINNSKILAGLGMIILNLFSKYIVINISKTQEAFIKNTITREIFIFIVLFVGTRDLFLSLILTGTFVILSGTLFNENSKFCMIPDKYKELYNEIDIDKDNNISPEEIKKAQDILYKANFQQEIKF